MSKKYKFGMSSFLVINEIRQVLVVGKELQHNVYIHRRCDGLIYRTLVLFHNMKISTSIVTMLGC